jgi:phosphate-selective porin
MMRQTTERRRGLRPAPGILLLAAILAVPALAQEAKPAPAVPAAQTLKLSGFTQFEAVGQSAGTDNLTVRRVRFTLAGDLLKNVKFKAAVDAVKSPILIDAQIDWTLRPAAAFRFGQFKVPFSQESLLSGADLDFVERSQAVLKLAPGQDLGCSGRDIGILFTGRASILEYAIGMFNGAGINKADTNNQKDLAARLTVRPAAGLSLAASVYDGRYSAQSGNAPVTRDRAGVEAAWTGRALSLKGEYIWARDGEVDRSGGYLQAGIFLRPGKIQALVRFDAYDKDGGAPGDRSEAWTAGLNWFFAGRTKLQVNYVLTRLEGGTTVNKAVQARLQVGY